MIKHLLKIAFVFALILTASVVLADWTAPVNPTPPTCTPGNPGCDAPINVSANRQVKFGPIDIRRTRVTPDANLLWLSDSVSADASGNSGAEIGKFGIAKFYNFYTNGNALQAVTNGADSLAFYAGGNGAGSYGTKSVANFVGTFTRAKVGLVASQRPDHWGVTASPSAVTSNPVVTLIDSGSYAGYFDGVVRVNGYRGTDTTLPVELQVNGKVGAREYCDENGQNCSTPPFSSGNLNISCPAGQYLVGISNNQPVCALVSLNSVANLVTSWNGSVTITSSNMTVTQVDTGVPYGVGQYTNAVSFSRGASQFDNNRRMDVRQPVPCANGTTWCIPVAGSGSSFSAHIGLVAWK